MVVSTRPRDLEEEYSRGRRIRVRFDRPLLPADVNRANLLLQTGRRSVFLLPRFDPVDRVLTFGRTQLLEPGVRYRFQVIEMRDLDFREQDGPFGAQFDTAVEDAVLESFAFVGWAEAGALLVSRCTGAGCHGPGPAALGLDLSSAEGIRATALGVVAQQTRVGVQTERPWRGLGGLAGLSRIDISGGVGRPAWSYLVYKVIGDPHVAGDRMPPAAPLTPDEQRTLSTWIASGAPTD